MGRPCHYNEQNLVTYYYSEYNLVTLVWFNIILWLTIKIDEFYDYIFIANKNLLLIKITLVNYDNK